MKRTGSTTPDGQGTVIKINLSHPYFEQVNDEESFSYMVGDILHELVHVHQSSYSEAKGGVLFVNSGYLSSDGGGIVGPKEEDHLRHLLRTVLHEATHVWQYQAITGGTALNDADARALINGRYSSMPPGMLSALNGDVPYAMQSNETHAFYMGDTASESIFPTPKPRPNP